MSDINRLDEHLKKSFSGYAPDVPPHIWENIATGKKRKKPVGFWLNWKTLVTALILIALTGGIVLFINNHNSNSKIIARENYINNTQAGISAQVPPAVVADNAVVPANQNLNAFPKDNKKNLQSTGNNQPFTNNNQNLSRSNAANTDIQNRSAKDIPAKKPVTNTSGADKKSNTIYNRQKNIAGKSTAQSRGNETSMTGGDTENENSKEIQEQVQQDFLIPRLLFSAEKLTAASLAEVNAKKTELKAIQIPGCPSDKDAAGNKQYWEVYAGPDYAFKKYNDTANSLLLEKRKASTNFHSAYSAGVRFTKVFNNGMSIRGGFNFSQINEKFSYAQSNVIQLTYEINQNGDTINSYYVRGTKYKTTYNRYRTIDIPLVVGYELGNGRLHANINAGAVVNIYSWQKGETLDTAFQPVSFTSDKTNSTYQYKNNVGIGFTGGVSIYYKLNDRLHLLAEPYYRYNFSPINKESLSIQEKFSTIGLRLGLRIDLE